MFQNNYKDIPVGIIAFEDRPDVVITTPTGETIGIELTECIYDERGMKESEYQIKFNERIINQLEDHINFKFHLDIELDNTNPLKKNQIESTTKEIIKLCIKEFTNLENNETRSIEQLNVDWNSAPTNIQELYNELGYRTLPKGISTINMSRYDTLDQSSNSKYKGGAVPHFTLEILNSILFKKEKALSSYKVCNQQWLVIGEGNDFYSYFKNIEIEKGFKTKFDKVFICRKWDSEVVVLK